jgi:hypothetical protein
LNLDVFANEHGLGPSKSGAAFNKTDSIRYLQKLSAEARKWGMSTGLKNAQKIIPDVLNEIEFAVNEECSVFEDCEDYKPLVDANKPIFHIEYVKPTTIGKRLQKMVYVPDEEYAQLNANQKRLVGISNRNDMESLRKEFCLQTPKNEYPGISTVIKNKDLDGWVLYCDKGFNFDMTPTTKAARSETGNGPKSSSCVTTKPAGGLRIND